MLSFFDKSQQSAYFRQSTASTMVMAGLACCLLFTNALWAQSELPASSPAASPASVPANAVPSSPIWTSLSPLEKESLLPLASTWETLGAIHKRKWMTLAQNYQSMAPAEQGKLHERMAEWAALKPREREVARLNFADTKKVNSTDRTASWEAYQALSAEDRSKLAKSKTKPHGAALAIKPVNPDKLASIPLIKNPPTSARAAIQLPVDRKTLLPQSVTRAASSPER